MYTNYNYIGIQMSKKEKATQCQSSLCCKATASLKKETDEELENEDRPLQELLDEKQPKSKR